MSLEKIVSECKNREDKLKTILGEKYFNISIFNPLSKFLNGNKICDMIDISLNLLNSTPIEKNKLIEIISLYNVDKALKILQNLSLFYLVNNSDSLDLFYQEKFTHLVNLYSKEETSKVISDLKENDLLLLINSLSKTNLIENKDLYFVLNYLNSNNITLLLNFVNNLSGNQKIKEDLLANLLNINLSVNDIDNFNKFIKALDSRPNSEKKLVIFYLIKNLYEYLFSAPDVDKKAKVNFLSKTGDALSKYDITRLFYIYEGFLSNDLRMRNNYTNILADENKIKYWWNILLLKEFSDEVNKSVSIKTSQIIGDLKDLTISIEDKHYFNEIERLMKMYPKDIARLLEYFNYFLRRDKTLFDSTINLAKKGFLEYLKILVIDEFRNLDKLERFFKLFDRPEYVDLLLTYANYEYESNLVKLENPSECLRDLNKYISERYNIYKELNQYQTYLFLSLKEPKRKRIVSLINKSSEERQNYYSKVLLGEYNFNIASLMTRNPLDCDGRKFNSGFCLPSENGKEGASRFSSLNPIILKNNIIDFLKNENNYIISYRIDGIPIGAAFLTVKGEVRVKLIEGNPFFHQPLIFNVVYNDILRRANEKGLNIIFEKNNESETYTDFLNYYNVIKNRD